MNMAIQGHTQAIKRIALLWLFGVLIGIMFSIRSASAQSATPRPPTDDEVNAIAREMYCPVCENTPLDVCPTQACAEWRELIRDKLVLGWSEKQIKQYFVDQYGDRVLATPPPRGLNWLVYLVPPLGFLAGIYILFRALRAWKRTEPASIPSAPKIESDDPYVSRLEEELRKR
jgi:cytochrome c-type biogenesis protein CcmH